MMDFLAKTLAELVFRCCVLVIERIASSQYANDVVDALHARWDRSGCVDAASSALRSVPTAVGSRLRAVPAAVLTFPRLLFLPVSSVAPALLFATVFYCYEALLASPSYTLLERGTRSIVPPTASVLAAMTFAVVPLIVWNRTRGRLIAILFVGLFASMVSPAFAGSLRFVFETLQLHASGVLAFTVVGAGSVLVFIRVWRLVVVLADSPHQEERDMIGFICFALAAARIMVLVHVGLGRGAGAAQVVFSLITELGSSLALACVLAFTVARIQRTIESQPVRRPAQYFTIFPWAWEGDFSVQQSAAAQKARVRAAIEHHVERGLWGEVVYRRGGRI